MVVMREMRDELALTLRRLVTGRMTNDEFDDGYSEKWYKCDDAAVSEVADFGWSLYSDFPTYKLKGRHAVPPVDRETASRAILFLQTDLDYQWPKNIKGVVPFFSLWGPGCFLFLALILLIVAAFSTGLNAVMFAVLGLVAIIPLFHWLATRRGRKEKLEEFYSSGDYVVWPFKTRDDFSKAKESPKYLAGVDDAEAR
jgi:hypothetical protein